MKAKLSRQKKNILGSVLPHHFLWKFVQIISMYSSLWKHIRMLDQMILFFLSIGIVQFLTSSMKYILQPHNKRYKLEYRTACSYSISICVQQGETFGLRNFMHKTRTVLACTNPFTWTLKSGKWDMIILAKCQQQSSCFVWISTWNLLKPHCQF